MRRESWRRGNLNILNTIREKSGLRTKTDIISSVALIKMFNRVEYLLSMAGTAHSTLLLAGIRTLNMKNFTNSNNNNEKELKPEIANFICPCHIVYDSH